MDTKRFLIAMGLSFLVLMVWAQIFPPPKPTPPPAATSSAPATAATGGEGSALTSTSTVAAPAGVAPSTAPANAATAEPGIEASTEERTTLETEAAIATFSNRGAQLVSYKLKKHLDENKQPLELVHQRAAGPYPLGLVDATGAALPINDALFQVDAEAGGSAAVFRYRGTLGRAEKRVAFLPSGLLEISVKHEGAPGWAVLFGPGVRNPPPGESQSRLALHGAVYDSAGSIGREPAPKAEKEIAVPGTGLTWAGLDDNYFLAVAMPTTAVEQAIYTPVLIEAPAGDRSATRFVSIPPNGELSKAQKALPRDFTMRLQARGNELGATTYWGAKQYDELAALPGGIQRSIDLGWFAVLARPLMIALGWTYDNVVHNYGWAIVLLTITIKLLLLPLTHKSMVSMKRMQEVRPREQAIRQRYAGKLRDKKGSVNWESQQKMNQEIMALYKSAGANPASGCLPILLQIPVFFAFYKILYSSVELRHAPWALGIADLSAPNVPLVVVMGATQILMQWMMPAMGNEMQRKIMLLMPVFFIVLFWQFPAGLVLYWLVQNIFSIVQQMVYNKIRKDNGTTAVPAKA